MFDFKIIWLIHLLLEAMSRHYFTNKPAAAGYFESVWPIFDSTAINSFVSFFIFPPAVEIFTQFRFHFNIFL